MTKTMKKMFIIAGCNGAGKTTASYTVLPDMLDCKEFVNADEIAKGLSPFNPESVSLAAGRIMLSRIRELMKEGVDFAFETTLATRSYAKLVKKAQRRGYYVTLVYFWLASPDLAIDRVRHRVEAGGHHIDNETVIRRYQNGLANFFELYLPVCNNWMIFDNTKFRSELIAKGSRHTTKTIYNPLVYKTLKNYE